MHNSCQAPDDPFKNRSKPCTIRLDTDMMVYLYETLGTFGYAPRNASELVKKSLMTMLQVVNPEYSKKRPQQESYEKVFGIMGIKNVCALGSDFNLDPNKFAKNLQILKDTKYVNPYLAHVNKVMNVISTIDGTDMKKYVLKAWEILTDNPKDLNKRQSLAGILQSENVHLKQAGQFLRSNVPELALIILKNHAPDIDISLQKAGAVVKEEDRAMKAEKSLKEHRKETRQVREFIQSTQAQEEVPVRDSPHIDTEEEIMPTNGVFAEDDMDSGRDDVFSHPPAPDNPNIPVQTSKHENVPLTQEMLDNARNTKE